MTSKRADEHKGFAERQADNRAAEASKPTPKPLDKSKDVKDENGKDHPAGIVPQLHPDTTMVGHEAVNNPTDQAQQNLDTNASEYQANVPKREDMAPNEGAHKETPEELQPSRHYAGPPKAA